MAEQLEYIGKGDKMPTIVSFNEYIPTDWVNGTTPSINEDNLNKIEAALVQNRDGLIAIGDIPGAGFDDKVGNVIEETGANKVVNMVYMTQAAYDNITPKTTTLYVIKG